MPPYGGARSPCGKLLRLRSVKAVYGPGTFINRSIAAVNLQLAALRRGDLAAIEQVAQQPSRSLARTAWMLRGALGGGAGRPA